MYPAYWAERTPDKVAAVNTTTCETLTYKELDENSNRFSNFMLERGLQRGDHIALFAENDLRYFVVLWAALRSGLYVTPISRHLMWGEAAYILRDSASKLLVASGTLKETADKLPELAPNCETFLSLDETLGEYEDFSESIARYSSEPRGHQWAGGVMFYSSGTTGRPKGIMRPLPDARVQDVAPLLGTFQNQVFGFNEQSVYLSPAPLYHAAPLNFTLAVHCLGGTVVMMPKFDPLKSLESIEKFGVTHSQWVPTMFSRLLKLSEYERRNFDLSSQRVAIHAGAPCPVEVKEAMFDWWGEILWEYYGGSEAIGLTVASPTDWVSHRGTVGRAFFGTVHVCSDNGEEVPTGESGLVYFEQESGDFEYHNDPQKTQESKHPAFTNWNTLGDIGFLDKDQFLYLTDRASFVIISGGVNIYPQEVENVLTIHPKVMDAAVIGVPNEEMGEEVKAVVQLEPGVEPTQTVEQELASFLRGYIAHYKCPKTFDFVCQLPRLPTGKLAKGQLKSAYWPPE